ncbi:MAG: response regulator [Deltaproteobacteria bacterium]|nr:response regulator [Deltaproteobacteria bacterium]
MSKLLGTMLVEAGVISADQLAATLARQRSFGGRLATLCWHLGLADERTLAVVLSRQLGVPCVVLSRSAIPLRAAKELPQGAATKLTALPLRREGRSLLVALANPKDYSALDELRFGTGARIVEHGALVGPLQRAIDDIYQRRELTATPFYLGSAADPSQIQGDEGILEIVRGDEIVRAGGDSVVGAPRAWGDHDAVGAVARAAPAARQGGPPIALVVDDEPAIRQILCEFLGRSGYTVRQAADGTAALQMLQAELPDVILLDAMLPGVHGFDICYRVKHSQATKHVRVIMISAIYRGWRYADDVQRLYGADAFLEKPFRLEDLKRLLDQTLSGRETAASTDDLTAQANALLQQAAASYRGGDPALAARQLEAAIAAAPFAADLHFRLSRLYDEINQPYRAIAALERAVELQPAFEHLQALARLYEKAGFVHKAFEAWERCFWACPGPQESERIRDHMNRLLPGS